MKIKLYFLSSIIVFLAIGCSEDKIEPLGNSKTPPGVVTNITVSNEPGQATLTYTLPNDQDLLYVKAVYPLASGKIKEVKASYYTNQMVLEGFGDTDEHEVQVFAVNRSEVESEEVTVIVKPLENPIWSIYRSMEILPDFAGVKIAAKNPARANVALDIITKDSLGKWQSLPSIYTSTQKIDRTTRGLDTIPQLFGVTIRDRFLNYTDTVFGTITPYYEETLSKSLYKEMKLPGDAELDQASIDLGGMPLMWDGKTHWNEFRRMITTTLNPDPQWITFDLGQKAKLSRIKIWNYAEEIVGQTNKFFYRGQMRFFEIWGSDNPNSDGSWDSWTLLGSYENIKPSGLPYGETSAEDFEIASEGFEYLLDSSAPKVKYIRIKSNKNWQGTAWFEILEVELYGDTRDK